MRDLTISTTSFILSVDIISVVICKERRTKKEDFLLLDPFQYLLCIPESAVDAVPVNPKGIKTLLANGLIKFYSTKLILFLVMDQEVYQEIFLIVPS